ncbi:MAG TPA: hypothetical protein VF861_15140 [Telluria sp.]
MLTSKQAAGVPEPPLPLNFQSETIVWRPGEPGNSHPLSILILNNMWLERPLLSGHFVPDLNGAPHSGDCALFTQSARYIVRNLFGELLGQAEKLLADSPYARKIRVTSMYVSGLGPSNATSLVGETDFADLIEPRRAFVPALLQTLGVDPDVVFLVSNSATHRRASAYAATDDDARGGIPFTCDGRLFHHRYYHRVPGMVAIHTTSNAMTAAHEFSHAFSSYTNGFVADLYVYGGLAFNRKAGRPIPPQFARYRGVTYRSDTTSTALGHPPDALAYHPEPVDPGQPALMDNFFLSSAGVGSRHDGLTKRYLLDRVEAKALRGERR